MVSGEKQNSKKRQERRDWLVACVLVVCVCVVAFWELMANRADRPYQPFELTADELSGFEHTLKEWAVRSLPVQHTSSEPNILTLELTDTATSKGASVLVRLVHGYNMCDCMRIKGYQVQLIGDTLASGLATNVLAGIAGDELPSGRLQAWRLTSEIGDISVWLSSMLRAADFSGTDLETSSMAFPRIGIPDNPGWLPRGFTLSSLRHPITNFKLLLRSKWNNARCDLPTFLKLRQPAWASDDLLTLIIADSSSLMSPAGETDAVARLVAVHRSVLLQLQEWGQRAE